MKEPSSPHDVDYADTRWVVLAGPGANPAQVGQEAFATAMDLLAKLHDPNQLGLLPGLPWRKGNGTCRICQTMGPLSFEHLPPQAAGNRERATGRNSWRELGLADESRIPAKGWFATQRGSGAFVLCRGCNSLCGRYYVNGYVEFAATVGETIANNSRPTPAGPAYPATFDLDLQGWYLGAVSRQAIAMLLAASGGGALAALEPELSDAVLRRRTTVGRTRLGLSLAFGSKVRLSPPVAVGTASGLAVFVEVAAEPFRWTLSWQTGGLIAPVGTTDVTHWLAIDPMMPSASEPLTFTLGAIESAAPGDMRDARSIDAQAHAYRSHDI
jgi:hypothetical protein